MDRKGRKEKKRHKSCESTSSSDEDDKKRKKAGKKAQKRKSASKSPDQQSPRKSASASVATPTFPEQKLMDQFKVEQTTTYQLITWCDTSPSKGTIPGYHTR